MMSQSSLLSEKAEEKSLKEKLEELQKQLGKKQSFEDAVSSIKSLFIQYYPSASPSLKKSMYSVVCRVATILRTRHTAPGFWLAGKGLFEEARHLVTESSQKQHLQDCISSALEHLPDHQAAAAENFSQFSQSGPSSRYLFEGHLTVDPEPPRPIWLVAQDVLSSIDVTAQSSQGDGENRFVEEFRSRMGRAFEDTQLDDVIEASLLEIGARPRGPPPASKEAVGKLPIIMVTEEILIRLGSEMECAVCRENLVVGDKMQELPCKHLFHPPCLKPWLDEHNSCPICRYELPTDDHAYESQKERDKEAEEERKGAANALRGGEYMYV